MSSNNDFKVFKETLSIGWHLSKLHSLSPDILKNKESWEQLVKWLERHNIKNEN